MLTAEQWKDMTDACGVITKIFLEFGTSNVIPPDIIC